MSDVSRSPAEGGGGRAQSAAGAAMKETLGQGDWRKNLTSQRTLFYSKWSLANGTFQKTLPADARLRQRAYRPEKKAAAHARVRTHAQMFARRQARAHTHAHELARMHKCTHAHTKKHT